MSVRNFIQEKNEATVSRWRNEREEKSTWKVDGSGDQWSSWTWTLTLWNLLMESIMGYTFWSLFHGLVPMIWFYPLNELAITGYEIFAASLLVPALATMLIGRRRMSALLAMPSVVVTLRMVTVTCMVTSFTAAHPSTYARLLILSAGVIASLLLLQASIWNRSAYKRCMGSLGLLVSYVTLLVSRIFYVSVLPTWADFSTCKMVATIVSAAIMAQIISDYDRMTSPNGFPSRDCDDGPWFRIGIGFGSLLYLTHSVFGEVSIPCRWVALNCPNPAGAIVLTAVVFGLILSNEIPLIASSARWWFGGGLVGIAALTLLPSVYGFAGGVMLGTYVFSVWPRFWSLIAQQSPGPVLTVTMATYILETLFSIWTIAYNFVPGGQLTREKTPVLMAFVILTIGAAVLWNDSKDAKTSHFSRAEIYLRKRCFRAVKSVLLLLLCLGYISFALRFQKHHSRWSVTKDAMLSSDFNALVWTYHFGYDNVGWPSLKRTAILLNDTGADVIGLLETDASKPFLGNTDIAMWLSERLNMHVDFGPSTRDHTWGLEMAFVIREFMRHKLFKNKISALLSRYPIVASKHHLLPSPQGELAPAVSATVNISGNLVDFVISHMGNYRDTIDRKLQAEYLARLISESENPIVFLGYVTSAPGSRDYTHLIQSGRLKDVDSEDMDRFCEYIMYRGLIRLGYARLSRGTLSDTELQMGKFRVPNGKKFRDNDRREIDVNRVPSDQLFTHKFGTYFAGDYHGDDHHYQMGTPKYFRPG